MYLLFVVPRMWREWEKLQAIATQYPTFLINWAFDECRVFSSSLAFYARNSRHTCAGMTFCALPSDRRRRKLTVINWKFIAIDFAIELRVFAIRCASVSFAQFPLIAHAKHTAFIFRFNCNWSAIINIGTFTHLWQQSLPLCLNVVGWLLFLLCACNNFVIVMAAHKQKSV